MNGVIGAGFVYVAYGTYKRRNLADPVNADAISPRHRMWMWLLLAIFLIGGIFWPLGWRLSLDLQLLGRMAAIVYCLFEAHQAYRQNSAPADHVQDSLPGNTAQDGMGLKIMGAIIIVFGVVFIGLGLWLGEFERFKITEWRRTTGVLVDKEFSGAGARLIFEYEVAGGRSSGRVDRWGQEAEMRAFLEPYRLGSSYGIGYNPEDPTQVDFHLGYNWDLFRVPIAIVIFGALFAAAGLVLGAPWREAPDFRPRVQRRFVRAPALRA